MLADMRHQIAADLIKLLNLTDEAPDRELRYRASVKLLITVVLVCCVLPKLVAAADDPFAGYHASLEERLSALAEGARVPATKSDARPPQGTTNIQATAPPAPLSVPLRGDRPAAIARLQKYRDRLERILDREGLPRAFVAVVLIESGGQPMAISPKQARGLWQLMPGTARDYGLVVTGTRDQRVEIESATRAAARYLRDLYSKFGDWQLVLAAYNAGPDTVDRAIQRGRTSSFTQLAGARLLPEETANYVPAVLSAMALLDPAATLESAAVRQPPAPAILYAPTSISN